MNDPIFSWQVVVLVAMLVFFVPLGVAKAIEMIEDAIAERQTKKLQAQWREDLANIEPINAEYERRILEAIAQHWESTRTTRTPKRIH